MAQPNSEDIALLDELASFEYDFYGFIMWAFPWGEDELAGQEGPDEWQKAEALSIGAELEAGGEMGAIIQHAIGSGHGVGKSAFCAWLILWAMTTYPRTRGVVTATNDTQLKTKTWAEVSTWHARFIAKHLFSLSATSIRSGDEKTAAFWRIDAIPWNANNPAGFAGLHNLGRRIVVIFDEASGIADIIWETIMGALTDARTQVIWVVMGNRTQTSGAFHRCFQDRGNRKDGKALNPWKHRTIDARTSKFSNKEYLDGLVEEYGEDSDFVRVRVRGLPPRAGISGFISPDVVFAARKREVFGDKYGAYPIEIGVDPARFGDDRSVIVVRQGLKVHKIVKFSGLDGFQLAARVSDLADAYPNVANICIDGIGIGASVVDVLRRHPRYGDRVQSVNVALPAVREDLYHNMRCELYGRMRDWMKESAIPDDDTLDEELTATQYGFDGKGRQQLEAKKDVKERIGRSPDMADALALTFFSNTMSPVGRIRNVQRLPVNRRTNNWRQHARQAHRGRSATRREAPCRGAVSIHQRRIPRSHQQQEGLNHEQPHHERRTEGDRHRWQFH